MEKGQNVEFSPTHISSIGPGKLKQIILNLEFKYLLEKHGYELGYGMLHLHKMTIRGKNWVSFQDLQRKHLIWSCTINRCTVVSHQHRLLIVFVVD